MIGAIENSLIFLEMCFGFASLLSANERQSLQKKNPKAYGQTQSVLGMQGTLGCLAPDLYL